MKMIRNKRKQMKLEFYRKISKLHIPKTQYLSNVINLKAEDIYS